MGILDVISLCDFGIVIAFLAVIAGILWERRVRQKQREKAKAIPPR